MVDIYTIYQKSFDTLNWVFVEHFKKSDDYQQLVLQLNENMIEYRFFREAGFQVKENKESIF